MEEPQLINTNAGSLNNNGPLKDIANQNEIHKEFNCAGISVDCQNNTPVNQASDISSLNLPTANVSQIDEDSNNSPIPKTNSTNASRTYSKMEPSFQFGPYVPILRTDKGVIIDSKGIVEDFYRSVPSGRTRRLSIEVLPDDAILDTSSLVTPLLLKKRTKWPPKAHIATNDAHVEPENNDDSSDSVQFIMSVDKNQSTTEKTAQTTGVSGATTTSNQTSPSRQNITKDNRKSTDKYVQQATVASLTHSRTSRDSQILSLNNYYTSSVGDMLIGIGLSRVQEFNLEADRRKLARRVKNCEDENSKSVEQENLTMIDSELSQARISNKPYKSNDIHKCPHCPFKTDSKNVMSAHIEVPHMDKRVFTCNWCNYRNKDSNLLVYHNLVVHKKRCRIEKEPALHNCSLCQFETKSKRKLVTHTNRCEQFFPYQSFRSPEIHEENDYPAITSKFISQEDIKAYEQALKTIRLAAYDPHQLKVSTGYQQQQLPLLVVPRQAGKNLTASFVIGNPVYNTNNLPTFMVGRNPIGSSLALLANPQSSDKNSIQNPNRSAQILHLIAAQQSEAIRNKTGILQHPKQTQSCFMNGKTVMRTAANIIMAPANPANQNINYQSADINDAGMNSNGDSKTERSLANGASSSSPAPKGCTFVICEICDSYIKDLSQLKAHMDLLHKVRIHSRTLESRPPLNCQKCQWRFFTDQGLERHLLGAHALITSNMQELVSSETDGGRCSVCGRAFANKLVAHMKDAHKANLKPAHLSYKCTVCAATFNLYRLFENHVYSVHSESVRRCSGK